MKTITHFMPKAAVFACGLFMLSANATAQTTSESTTSTRWKGCDVEKLDTSEVDRTTAQFKTVGTRFYLYNVGTGRFISADGEGGVKACTKYQDFGNYFTLGNSTALRERKRNLIYSMVEGTTEVHGKDQSPYVLGVSYPKLTTKNGSWTQHAGQIFGVIFSSGPETNDNIGEGKWSRTEMYFERVDSAQAPDVYTYRIREHLENVDKKTKYYDFYIGAYAGRDVWSNSKADVVIGRDSVVFSENGANSYVVANTDFYKWRFVTEAEMESIAKDENADNHGGLVANLSYLIKDPFFNANRDSEFKTWQTENFSTEEVKKEGKTWDGYRYTWAGADTTQVSQTVYTSNDLLGKYTRQAPWDAVVLRKLHFGTNRDGKYTYAMLDGKGKAKQTVTVPMKGYYMVQCRGVANNETSKAALFAQGEGAEKTAAFKIEGDLGAKVGIYHDPKDKDREWEYEFYREEFDYEGAEPSDKRWLNYRIYYQRYAGKYDNLLNIGKRIHEDGGDEYAVSVIVKVGDNLQLTYGVRKDEATKSSALKKEYQHSVSSGWDNPDIIATHYCYYDTDIAAFDNFQIYYLGTEEPFLLNQDKDDDAYITTKIADETVITAPSGNKVKANSNVTTYLKRKFSTAEDGEFLWNTLVLPVSMTADQVIQYFGEGTHLATLDGANTISTESKKYMIDFRTVALTEAVTDKDGSPIYDDNQKPLEKVKDGTVVNAGQLYIIKPTKVAGDLYPMSAEGEEEQCYLIGRHNFGSGKANPTTETKTSDGGKITTHGTYKLLNSTDKEAPQPGTYVFGTDGQMYHIDSPIKMRGFRGWLSAEGKDGQVRPLMFALDSDNTVTFIDGIREQVAGETGNIYTLNGQLVRSNAASTDGLPKGIYIVNGKKVVVTNK